MKHVPWSSEEPPPNTLGVYIIFNTWYVEYVGQGVVANRLDEWPDERHWWTAVPSENERLGMESFLIRLLEPRQNKTSGANVEEVPVRPPEVPLTVGAADKLSEALYPH